MVLAPLSNQAPTSVKNARESSLPVRGAKLFDAVLREIRDTSTGTTDMFKLKLDEWLSRVPDQPTIPDRQRAARNNSILNQVHYILQN